MWQVFKWGPRHYLNRASHYCTLKERGLFFPTHYDFGQRVHIAQFEGYINSSAGEEGMGECLGPETILLVCFPQLTVLSPLEESLSYSLLKSLYFKSHIFLKWCLSERPCSNDPFLCHAWYLLSKANWSAILDVHVPKFPQMFLLHTKHCEPLSRKDRGVYVNECVLHVIDSKCWLTLIYNNKYCLMELKLMRNISIPCHIS